MCGRYALYRPISRRRWRIAVDNWRDTGPRYNIAPSQTVPVIRWSAEGRELTGAQWGLIPGWATDPHIGHRMINARAETVTTKAALRDAWLHRRCLLPASGFYEWHWSGDRRQPHFVRLASDEVFLIGGLWEIWRGTEGESLESCAIITTPANELVQPLHERMPLIIAGRAIKTWLNAGSQQAGELLRPHPAQGMQAYAVSTAVNSPRNDGPELIEPVAA
jgi:putative SOS response-associated peptidase YedK